MAGVVGTPAALEYVLMFLFCFFRIEILTCLYTGSLQVIYSA